MELNVFKNLKDTTVNESMPIVQWLTDIKMGKNSDKVMFLRKLTKKTDIDEFKKKEMPCIIYNVSLDKERNNGNIISDTGYFFIDIDVPFDTRLLNRSKIFALYKSCTGRGIHIIVQVDGLTKENYHSSYDFICDNLGITEYVDKSAKKIAQASLTSYDPDLFFNYNSLKFDLSKLIQTAPISSLISKTNKKETYKVNWGQQKFRFTNIQDFDFNKKDYLVDWGNLDFIQAYKGKNIGIGKRKTSLLAYTVNFVSLNEHLEKEEVISIIKNVNDTMFTTPLEYSDVLSVVNSVFKYKKEDKLKPIIKKRSILFDPKSEYSSEEKVEITLQLLAERKTEHSKLKLYNIIENWDFNKYGLISQRNIANNFDINIKTVEKYYKEFKDWILELNMTNKLS